MQLFYRVTSTTQFFPGNMYIIKVTLDSTCKIIHILFSFVYFNILAHNSWRDFCTIFIVNQ